MFSVSVCSSMCSGPWGRGGRYTVKPPPWYSASLMHHQHARNNRKNSEALAFKERRKKAQAKSAKVKEKTKPCTEKKKKAEGKLLSTLIGKFQLYQLYS